MAVNIAKLREQARTHEARDQWREAISAYRQILENPEGGDVDIGLWNRIGDLHIRQNEQDKAVEAYESAVNAYVDVGLYNNAIALCRKILRLVPGRAAVYRRLGQISAAKGFFADARQNFLEYADRMRRAGQIDSAFEALREFADLSPDDAEIRRVLADQLLSHGHKDEAVEQLRILLGMLLARGDEEAAEAVRQQIRAVDETASTEPLARAAQAASGDDFHSAFHADLNDDLGGPSAPAAPADPRAGLSMGAALDDTPSSAAEPIAVEGLELSHDFGRPEAEPPARAAQPPAEEEGEALPLIDFDSSPAPAEPAAFGEISLEPTALDFGGDEEEEDESEGGAELPMMDFGSEDEPLPMVSTEDESLYGNVVDLSGDQGSGFGTVELPAGDADAFGTIDLPDADDGFGTVDLPMMDTGYGSVELPEAEEEQEALPYLSDEAPTVDLPAEGGDPEQSLTARLEANPGDHEARDRLVDLLHEQERSAEAMEVLEKAHRALADGGRWRDAIVPLSHLIRLRPGDDGPLLQKRVEYAFRSGERSAMVEAYLALARHFDSQGNSEKARAVFGRVLEIEPPNTEAKEAIAGLDARAGVAAQPAAAAAPVEDYIDLGALIMDGDMEPTGGTRFIVEEHEPTGDEDRDFADMLKHFREKVAENIEVEDSSSHYDLGLAFKEMGLVDEAIAEFQVALRGGWDPLATLEMLGACFVDKGQFAVATRVLERALRLPTSSDAEMVGVLYQLGRSYEAMGNPGQATEYYERVLSVDIRFRDTSARLEATRAGGAA